MSGRFPLAPRERDFHDRHRPHDRSYLVHWLVVDHYDLPRDEQQKFIRARAEGRHPEGIPEVLAALVSGPARLTVGGDFNQRLKQESPVASR
ncbi:hypothetical protein ACFYZI_38845 [Streptomyces griseorubiginosus]|uniref:hypothetical protein n=1 Tax=Streptomyces griseorubiginosus TaxID=67304 RepID=UPI00367401DF